MTKILAECQQEVPEFLIGGGAAAMAGGASGGFGGVDIRGGQDAVQMNAAADDEEW